MKYFPKRAFLSLFIFILFLSFFLLNKVSDVQAQCHIECIESVCGGKNYKPKPGEAPRPGFDENGYKKCTQCSSICVPTPTPTHCIRMTQLCRVTCGQMRQCIPDGCGGETCCSATEPCNQCNPPCAVNETCKIPNQCPAGAYCIMAELPPVCVPNTPTPTTPPPSPTPDLCALRSRGDANCRDGVNTVDFDIFKSYFRGEAVQNQSFSADFNRDSKVNLMDFEIWRNTVYN